MRMYKEIPRNTTRFQGIRRNTTRFQGIQRNAQGALSRTEWHADVDRDSKECNEMPRNTKEYKEIPRNTRKYKRSTKWNRMVCECTKRFPGIQCDSK